MLIARGLEWYKKVVYTEGSVFYSDVFSQNLIANIFANCLLEFIDGTYDMAQYLSLIV